ncbi:hypothetical protein LCGC14_0428230 [marine sediment metagenome]|uniref:Uncharacterized protein n=1 Tax=marine sediment metagenome TaxID=412755 RepID=A0A0F9VY69_9ZZZZ
MATRIRPDGTELNCCLECDDHQDHEVISPCGCLVLGLRNIPQAVDRGAQLFPTWCSLPRGGYDLVTSKEGK